MQEGLQADYRFSSCAASAIAGSCKSCQQRSSVAWRCPDLSQVNPLYLPQLKQALTFPQSVGIVGGRPGSSLYFIGHHEDRLLYLDPHDTQPVLPLPTAASTYFCGAVRLMPMATMDPSLAIGFLCAGQGEHRQLAAGLAQTFHAQRLSASEAGVALGHRDCQAAACVHPSMRQSVLLLPPVAQVTLMTCARGWSS